MRDFSHRLSLLALLSSGLMFATSCSLTDAVLETLRLVLV